ncbi:MAG TPA: HigA family addiction module antitoxin [Acidisarcina sp.]|nr:HigA family addiction module antitoxin [Acidisarcina sp.]
MDKTFAVHPGEILRHEFMQPMGLTAYRLAKEINVPVPRINDIVRAKRSISANTALRLAKYFGISAQFWLNLQNRFDLAEAAKDKTISRVKQRASEAA